MALINEIKRIRYGQALVDLENQLVSAIAQIKTIRQNLVNLKAEMENNTDIASTDDIKEVDNVIAKVDTELSNLQSQLK